ncbi:MAG: hypothetical protein AAGK78_16770, partial [Planctomycetota bacterium]
PRSAWRATGSGRRPATRQLRRRRADELSADTIADKANASPAIGFGSIADVKEERGRVDGDITINEPYTLWGSVTGDLRVVEGGKVYVRGNVGQDLIVDFKGRVHVYGHVGGNIVLFRGAKLILSGVCAGNVENKNARFYTDEHGKVLGKVKTKGKHAESHIHNGYEVRIVYGQEK